MSRAALRRALREERRALRRRLADERRRLRETLAAQPLARRARARRRLRRSLAGAGALLLLLLFIRCPCEAPPAPTPVLAAVPDAGAKVAKVPPPPAKKPSAVRLGLSKNPRGTLVTGSSGVPAWLEEFRLQVAARSPRLAKCFEGSDRPGALRWSTAMNSQSGVVSDQQLESVGELALETKQEACVRSVLSSPPYRFDSETRAERALAERVSLVIEF